MSSADAVLPLPAAADGPPDPPPRRRRWRWWLAGVGLLVLLLTALALFIRWEMRHSVLQARYLSAWARQLGFTLEPGPASGNRYPQAGPYDERLGYTRLPTHLQRLTERHHAVTA